MYPSLLPCNPFIDDLKPEFGLIDVNRDLTAEQGCVFGMPMAEDGGTTVRDVVGGGNGAISGATWVPTPYGPGLSFGGAATPGRVAVTPVAPLLMAAQFTVSALVYITAYPTGGNDAVIYRASGGVGDHQYLAIDSGGHLSFNAYNGSSVLGAYQQGTAGSVPVGAWIRVTGTWDGTTWRSYVGTSLIGSVAGASYVPATLSNVDIGSYGTGRYLNGVVADVHVCTKALPVSEIARLAPDPFVLYRQDRRNVFAVSSSVLFRRCLSARAGSRSLSI